MAQRNQRSVDGATLEMLDVADRAGMQTSWDRLEAQQPQCGFGKLGICCRNCSMGPCRIDPFEGGAKEGICGATAGTIVARNLMRHICCGTSAHSDHARELIHALLLASTGTSEAYTIKGPAKLRRLADGYAIAHEGRSDRDVAADVARFLLAEFGRQEGVLANTQRAPDQQRKNWAAEAATPRGIDREVVTGMHATHIGADNEAKHILMAAVRTALADGWGGCMIASDVSDVLFGEPQPLRSRVNLGVLKADEVNLVVHGHEPTLSDVIVAASRDPELLAEAKAKGATGINLAGICCTANEILMRHGVPIAGNFLQQELAVMTGVVDVMLVDIQCVFPALTRLQDCFHTKVVSTSQKAHFPGAMQVDFCEEEAMEIAKRIVRIAIDNFPNRDPNKVHIPKEEEPLVAGFTTEVIFEILGGRYRPSFRPLNDAIQTGRIRGVAGRGRMQQSEDPPRFGPSRHGRGTRPERRAGGSDGL